MGLSAAHTSGPGAVAVRVASRARAHEDLPISTSAVGTGKGLLTTMWGVTLLTLAVVGHAVQSVGAAPIATVDMGAVEMLSRDSVSRMQTLNLEQVNAPPRPGLFTPAHALLRFKRVLGSCD